MTQDAEGLKAARIDAMLDDLIHCVRSHERSPDKYTADEIMIARRVLKDELLNLRASAAKAGEGWQPIETAPKGRKLLVGYFNELGKWRTVTGCYYIEDSLEQDDPDSDDEYAPAGWYEESDSLEQIARTSCLPTHWQPLPAPPSAAPGEAKCDTCKGFRVVNIDDWRQQPCPDCAPSPEQQGAEQRGTCCATDCNNAASEGWYCMAHAEARAAELMAKVTAEDEPDGCDCPHASAARSCGCGFCRALNCTAPASALGLTQDERAAALDFAERIEGLNGFNKGRAERELLLKVAAFLRSMLERGKP
jgi:hypothetical protein